MLVKTERLSQSIEAEGFWKINSNLCAKAGWQVCAESTPSAAGTEDWWQQGITVHVAKWWWAQWLGTEINARQNLTVSGTKDGVLVSSILSWIDSGISPKAETPALREIMSLFLHMLSTRIYKVLWICQVRPLENGNYTIWNCWHSTTLIYKRQLICWI